jgi:hypothetical protein
MKIPPFFNVKTRRVVTWQGKVILLVALLLTLWLLWPLFRIGITQYIYCVDELKPAPRIVVENWDCQIDVFEESARIADSAGAGEIYSIIINDAFRDPRKRQAYMLNAWAAGIDTTHFSLIPATKEDPKTLHIAQAVLDTAYQRRWQEITIVTADLHTARSRKAYILAAEPRHIAIRVVGVPYEGVGSNNWSETSTGLSMAFAETIKKLYYDLFVF